MSDADGTLLDAPHARKRAAAETRSQAPADDLSFASALRSAEVGRAKQFVPILLGMLAVGVLFMFVAGGDPVAKAGVLAGIAASAIAISYLLVLTRHPAAFTELRLTAIYAVCMLGFHAGAYFWGVFSPVAAIGALGIFFLGIGRNPRTALFLYLLCVVPQAALAVAIIAGALRDRGLVTAARPDVAEQVVQQVMLQAVYAVTYLMARSTRAQLDHAVRDHERAIRAVAARDALLVEARQDLDRALKVGGPGRFTDQRVGSFRLGVMIGRGAMGDVYEAVHVETGVPAAVKLLGAGPLSRFYREASAVAKLESPHIVRLLEVSAADAELPYIAMERLHGQDLAHVLREQRRLTLGEVRTLATQVARGLEAARAAGIVHRDIKPQNLFRHDGAGQPVWKVLDFGVSKLADQSGTLTTDHVVGTPMYMAPEQARGQPVDHRADICALATVIYRALTGQPPHAGSDIPAIMYAVVHRMPQRPGDLVKLPADVDRVLAIGLAKDPEQRFATATQLADALAAGAASKLPESLRARADALLAAKPWGAE